MGLLARDVCTVLGSGRLLEPDGAHVIPRAPDALSAV